MSGGVLGPQTSEDDQTDLCGRSSILPRHIPVLQKPSGKDIIIQGSSPGPRLDELLYHFHRRLCMTIGACVIWWLQHQRHHAGLQTEPPGDHILGDYSPEETLNQSAQSEWANKRWIRRLLRICSPVSLASVWADTPKSKELYPSLKHITFCSDLSVTFFFTVKTVAKMQARGILKGEGSYLKALAKNRN
ncbi:Sodium leak channel non-selective protein [Chionoecetes opilio]|uniref:Sodium leak channel non-selective protein n=1 Tax=Chionoecetes opilio TaxID=41210 RepID=A0A8J4YU08_CHIOP|nr:Sodium leak channel non-selective protein [Chionoecetes opilio]